MNPTPPRDRLAEIERALEPFAEAAMHLHPMHPDSHTTLDGIECGQWRAASAALTILAEMRADMEGLAELSARATPGEWFATASTENQQPLDYDADFYEYAPNLTETDDKVYTVSTFENYSGWQTDSGCSGYGIKKDDADLIARSVNVIRKWLGETA